MRAVRVQAAVLSGKVILRVRNTLDTPLVLSKAILVKVEDEKKAAPILAAPLVLEPGEIRALNITQPVLQLLKPSPIALAITMPIKLRLFFDAPNSDPLYEADCTVCVDRGSVVEFAC